MAKDYYDVLGVPRGADEATIRKAYRRKARELHPDVNPDDATAEARFKDVQEAYSVLSDAKKKALYDRFGHAGVGRGGARGGPTPWPPGGGTAVPDLDDLLGGGLDGIFETLFGGAVGGAGARDPRSTTRTQPQQARPRPSRHEQPVRVSLLEAINGVQQRVRSGGRSLDVTIPAGVRDGSRVRVRGAGPNGADLYLIVQLEADPNLEPDGAHLRTVVRVDLYDALLGGSAEVATPEGAVSLTIPPGTANGRVFRINGRGLPDAKGQNRRGDVLAKVEVVLPESLDEEERQLVERLRGLREDREGGARSS